MERQRGLGRGLGALLGDTAVTAQEGSATLSISLIQPNAAQPRKDFDPDSLSDLADSIREHGIIQPLTVRRLPDGYYQIIAGERRWRAARMAELDEIPVIIVEADDRRSMELALVENLQREDLGALEEAEGYRTLIEDYGLTQEEAAARVGKSRPTVANSLRLLGLTPAVLSLISEGKLTAGHARAVLQLPADSLREQAARQIVKKEMSVRQAEAYVKNLREEKDTAPDNDAGVVVNYIAEAEKSLAARLGRKVRIVTGRKKGRLELEYYGDDDLQTLLDSLLTL